MAQYTSAGSLRSYTRYCFDLQKRELAILDRDIFIPLKPVAIRAGQPIPLKVVTSHVREVSRASLCQACADCCEVCRPPESNDTIAEVRFDGTRFSFIPSSDLGVTPSRPVCLALEYQVALQGIGPCLFYCGSVQPSDYQHLKGYLDLERVRKRVELRVRSTSPFEAWCFHGQEPTAFPPATTSTEDRDSHTHTFDHHLVVSPGDWRRAQYFGLFVRIDSHHVLSDRHS